MGQVIFKRMWAWLMHTRLYIRALGKWISLAVVTGLACGVVGSAFHIGVEGATMLRQLHPWLLWCLPAAGLLVALVLAYRNRGLLTVALASTATVFAVQQVLLWMGW